MRMIRKLVTGILYAAFATLFSHPVIAGMQLGVSGAWAKNHLGLEVHTMQMGKATASVDLGSYLRLGYSFAQISQHREGYQDQASEGEKADYVYFQQDVVQNTHSVDLFAVLYAGSVFTPYIFAGAAMKYYEIRTEKDGRKLKPQTGKEPSPNYGVGLSIAMSQSFSMKVANTWSLGVITTTDGQQKMARDSQFEAGITYAIR